MEGSSVLVWTHPSPGRGHLTQCRHHPAGVPGQSPSSEGGALALSQQGGAGRGKGLRVGRSEGLPPQPQTPALAHLVEGVEVPFAHVLLKDSRLWREGQLGPCLGCDPTQGTPPRGATHPLAQCRQRGSGGPGTEEPHLQAWDLRESAPAPPLGTQAWKGQHVSPVAAGPTFSSR